MLAVGALRTVSEGGGGERLEDFDPALDTRMSPGSYGIIGNPVDNALLAFGNEPYGGIDQCDKFVVSMGGSTQSWQGVIYGPNGLIEMNGSSNTTFTGSLIGFSVRLNGSDITIIADPSIAQGQPFVRLAE